MLSVTERFNGFMKTRLDNLLLNDLWNYWIFNESDLHSAVYYYIRQYFQKKQSESALNIYVRCEPRMEDNKSPDIVVFKGYDPIYIVEMKMYPRAEAINEKSAVTDLLKLKSYLSSYPSLKWGFFILVYDSDYMLTYSPHTLKRDGFEKVSFISINMRRTEQTRKRVGYVKWRRDFDKLLERHR